MMDIDVQNLPAESRYRMFEALSHPTRVRILRLVSEKEVTFSSLKRELGLESSGQLQHHLQKLSGFIDIERQSGCYALTVIGGRALDVYVSSERTGRPLESICCIPTATEAAAAVRVGRTGTMLRLSLAGMLLAATVVGVALYLAYGELGVGIYVSGSSTSVEFGLSAAIITGFFGFSFLIAGIHGSPGCEITAIPNLFSGRRRYYCACLITPFNLPDGKLLER